MILRGDDDGVQFHPNPIPIPPLLPPTAPLPPTEVGPPIAPGTFLVRSLIVVVVVVTASGVVPASDAVGDIHPGPGRLLRSPGLAVAG